MCGYLYICSAPSVDGLSADPASWFNIFTPRREQTHKFLTLGISCQILRQQLWARRQTLVTEYSRLSLAFYLKHFLYMSWFSDVENRPSSQLQQSSEDVQSMKRIVKEPKKWSCVLNISASVYLDVSLDAFTPDVFVRDPNHNQRCKTFVDENSWSWLWSKGMLFDSYLGWNNFGTFGTITQKWKQDVIEPGTGKMSHWTMRPEESVTSLKMYITGIFQKAEKAEKMKSRKSFMLLHSYNLSRGTEPTEADCVLCFAEQAKGAVSNVNNAENVSFRWNHGAESPDEMMKVCTCEY